MLTLIKMDLTNGTATNKSGNFMLRYEVTDDGGDTLLFSLHGWIRII